MSENPEPSHGDIAARESNRLTGIGCMMMLLGALVPMLVSGLARPMGAGGVRSVLLILSDILRLSFFVGLACLVIGLVRSFRRPK